MVRKVSQPQGSSVFTCLLKCHLHSVWWLLSPASRYETNECSSTGECLGSHPACRFSLSSWKMGDVTRLLREPGWNCLVSNKEASSGSCKRRRRTGMSQGAPLALPTLEHCGTNTSAPALWIVLWRKNRVKENNVLPLTLIHSSCLTFDCVRLGRSCGLLGGMKHGLVSREDGGSYRLFMWNEK